VSSPPRKPPGERLRRLVHFLLTDDDYIRLLEASKGEDVSAWCRDVIKKALKPRECDKCDLPLTLDEPVVHRDCFHEWCVMDMETGKNSRSREIVAWLRTLGPGDAQHIADAIEKDEISVSHCATCSHCNFDRHVCPGCGKPTPHVRDEAIEVCKDCETPKPVTRISDRHSPECDCEACRIGY
jgi:hypothetical protein